jgi:hypothetical protein
MVIIIFTHVNGWNFLYSLQEPETEMCSSMLDSINQCMQVSFFACHQICFDCLKKFSAIDSHKASPGTLMLYVFYNTC